MDIITKEDEKVVKDFQTHVAKKSIKIIYIISLVFGAVSLLWLFFGDYIIGITGLVISALFPFIFNRIVKKENKKLNDSNKLMVTSKKVEFKFEEQKFSYKTYLGEEMVNYCVIDYKNLYCIDETNDYFFLFLGINQGLCLSKIDTRENTDKLRELLQTNCPKYKKFDR